VTVCDSHQLPLYVPVSLCGYEAVAHV